MAVGAQDTWSQHGFTKNISTPILSWHYGIYRRRFCIAIRQVLCNERSMALYFFSKPRPVLQPVQLSSLYFSSSTLYNNVAIMTSSLIFAASALLSFAAAVPVQDHLHSRFLETRQALNCNIGTGLDNQDAYDSSCWDTLNIMPYLTNWKATTPTCTDAETSAGQTLSCCGASEPWSTCFLRLATKQSTYDCTQVGLKCPLGATSALDPGLDPTIASQVNYVVLNIVTINNFFTAYYAGQLLSTCLTPTSSVDHQSSSPKCATKPRTKLEFIDL